MRSLWVFSIFMALPLTVGCGRDASDNSYRPEAFQGKVDTALSRDLRVKQEALRRLLNALREGVGEPTALRLFAPGVDFRESFDRFFEGTPRLARWQFNGRPRGNEVPVVLYFDPKGDGRSTPETERRVERIYLVSQSGRQFTVARK